MKRKFTALLLCLLMIVGCTLAGCASFSIDKVKYYNEVLAKIGDEHITRYDLLTAYSNYGNNYYVSQLGESEEEALSDTLNLLIDRENLYQYCVEDKANTFRPTAYQVNSVIEKMFDSLDESFETYVKKAKTILNIKEDETEDDSSTDDKAYKYSDYVYKKRATIKNVNGTQKIEYVEESEPTSYNKIIETKYLNDFNHSDTVSKIKEEYLKHLKSKLEIDETKNAEKLYNKSISLFSESLINYETYLLDENGKPFNKDTNDLIYRYFERTFKSQIKSQYLTNLQNHYLKNETLSIENLVTKYNYLYSVSKNLYSRNEGTYKSKMKDIGTDGDSILYHPTTLKDNTEFGYFIHTLISFSDKQKNEIKGIENIKSQDEDLYNSTYNSIIAKTSVKPRDAETGIESEDSVGLTAILEEYNSIKNTLNYGDRLSKFIQFMFKYTGDTSTMNSGMPYVVGTNGFSAMETAFTKECCNLMGYTVDDNNYTKTSEALLGAMSDADINDIDSLCITSYGIHLCFYVGPVDAYDLKESAMNPYISLTNKLDDENGLYNLYYKKINPLTNETYFDMLFDKVYPASSDQVYTSNTGYSDFEKQITNSRQNKVVKYTTKIKATKTSLN